MRISNCGLVVLIFLFSGCASNRMKTQENLREAFLNNQYQTCNELIEKENPSENENSKILYYMDKARIYHDQGNYFLATKMLEEARKIDKKLFTKSLSKKGLTYFSNDNLDVYYGASYERSLIHFYLALNYFLIHQRGHEEAYSYGELMSGMKIPEEEKEKVIPQKELKGKARYNYLVRARASILAWDSMLNSLKDSRMGKSVFKNDMLAKILGAYIHESFNRSSDNQIALQLYKDAKKLLVKNYSSYKTFNKKFVSFKKNFEKFPSLGIATVEAQYIDKTKEFEDLDEFLTLNILRLTTKMRPRELSRLYKIYNVDKKTREKAALIAKKDVNVRVFVESGLIPPKTAKRVNIGFEGFLNSIEDEKTRAAVQAIGVPVLSMFMANTLGLVPNENNWSMPGAVLGLEVSRFAVSHVGFSFELPEVINKPFERKIGIEIMDQQGEIVGNQILTLVNPLNDIAEEAVAEDSMSRYLKLGVRVGMKHIAAILSAYATYKTMATKKEMKFFAKNAAIVQYTALSKGIEMTEKADLRYWSLLSQDIRAGDFYLTEGTYFIKAKVYNPDDEKIFKVFDLGQYTVSDRKENHILNYRVKNLLL